MSRGYAAMVRRRFEGGGLVTAKFVTRADDVQPVEVIKEYEDAEKGEVLACFEALTSLRSLLPSTAAVCVSNVCVLMWCARSASGGGGRFCAEILLARAHSAH